MLRIGDLQHRVRDGIIVAAIVLGMAPAPGWGQSLQNSNKARRPSFNERQSPVVRVVRGSSQDEHVAFDPERVKLIEPGRIDGESAARHALQEAAGRDTLKLDLIVPKGNVGYAIRPPSSDVAPLAPMGESISIFSYDLAYQGTRLSRQSSRSLIIIDGRPFFIRSRNLPTRVEERPRIDPAPHQNVAIKDAEATCRSLFYPDQAPLQTLDEGTEIWVDAERLGHWARVVTVISEKKELPFARRYWITEHHDEQILDHEDLLCFDLQIQATGSVWPILSSPMYPDLTDQPLSNLRVLRVGNGGGSKTTSEKGIADFPPIPGQAARKVGAGVKAHLEGPYCLVYNKQGDDLIRHNQGPEDSPLRLDFRSKDHAEVAQVSAFYYVNRTHEFVNSYLPKRLEKIQALGVYVNFPIFSTSNAWYDAADRTLNFAQDPPPGQPFPPNLAYAGPVIHEYAHAVDDELQGIQNADGGAYKEGFADSVVILMTGEPLIGRDFRGPGKPLRDASNLPPPPPANPDEDDPHERGLLYAGFTWELLQNLWRTLEESKMFSDRASVEREAAATAKHLILRAAMLNPDSIEQAVRYSFFVDVTERRGRFYNELKAAAKARSILIPSDPKDLKSKLIKPD